MKNPIIDGWYADPEARVYGDTVYMYVTRSLPFEEQKNLDLVTSTDLESFTVHRGILDMSTFRGAEFAIWAPTVIEKGGKYYIVFAANDIHSEEEIGGLYIGVCDDPRGPFTNLISDGGPLVNRIYGGAQPIDAHLFADGDRIYLFWGGWRHLMVAVMNERMDGFLPMKGADFDGAVKELTPEGYVEAPYVEKLGDSYHLLYSSGNWENGSYRVKAAKSASPCGEFKHYGDILTASEIADGPGHNGVFVWKGEHYTAYHRRTVGDGNSHHRRLAIDKISTEGDRFNPVIMT